MLNPTRSLTWPLFSIGEQEPDREIDRELLGLIGELSINILLDSNRGTKPEVSGDLPDPAIPALSGIVVEDLWRKLMTQVASLDFRYHPSPS